MVVNGGKEEMNATLLSRAALVTQMIEERVNLAFKFNSHA